MGQRGGPGDDLAKTRHSELDGGGLAGAVVEVGELGLGSGQADVQAFGLTQPTLALGFGDARQEIAADLLKPWSLGGVNAEERASDAAVLMLAAGAVGAAAVAQGDLAPFEVAEKLIPFGVGGDAV
ncbi:hypothetical protein HCN51_56830 [Nonomuraea sp. FMUSA5-5]|uniref:Uncharacterized protein n=1 Tax=Nonomuraea composti TaxID=2720023 RepID=A0ABX1BSL9_9ACTN|nr:hypothetical protein [Nonomuraea sp. FMUSA5-5]NJP98791.1 hypothetical protein [Nonomuraea sp. FMUSA5-5]